MIIGIRQTAIAGMRVDAIPTLDIVLAAITEALRDHVCFLVTFANPGTTVAVQRQKAGNVFDRFDIVAPDGIAMVKAIQWVHHAPTIRISFDSTSLAPHVFRMAVEQGSRIVLCGGRPGVAAHAAVILSQQFTGLRIIGALQGYATWGENIGEIVRLSPDIVICGMGGVIQETFLLALTRGGWSGVAFTCGGYLDQLSQGLQYYPKWVDKYNMRWAYRLAKEPRRLWRRYLLDYPVFAFRVAKKLIHPEGK